MAKTRKFPVTITLGDKAYAPGEDVPIGGKIGLPEEDAGKIEATHGTWDGSAVAARKAGATDNSEAIEKAVSAAQAKHAAEVAKIREAWASVQASLAADEGSDDAGRLEERMKALTDLLPQG